MVSRASIPTLPELASGDKRVLAHALAAIETDAGSPGLAALLDAACAAPRGHVLGLTGPPGVGKSTLASALVTRARARGETIGVIAVDPSSRRTGGALLGDRARIATDPNDAGVYIRSMAARDRLGGLSNETIAAMVLMRAIYDRVLIESVGIGQSEADISFAADTVVLCVQPGSGDSLQFMKAGVMELPEVIAVTKSDMGAAAQRARGDVEGALSLNSAPGWRAPVVSVAATRTEGVDELEAAIAQHRDFLAGADRLARRRRAQERSWIDETIRTRFGSEGLMVARTLRIDAPGPFTNELLIATELSRRFL